MDLIYGAYAWATFVSVGLFGFLWRYISHQFGTLWKRLHKLETNHIAHIQAELDEYRERLGHLETNCSTCPHKQ